MIRPERSPVQERNTVMPVMTRRVRLHSASWSTSSLIREWASQKVPTLSQDTRLTTSTTLTRLERKVRARVSLVSCTGARGPVLLLVQAGRPSRRRERRAVTRLMVTSHTESSGCRGHESRNTRPRLRPVTP